MLFPAAPVVTVPTLTVAAAPEGPVAPTTPFTARGLDFAGLTGSVTNSTQVTYQ